MSSYELWKVCATRQGHFDQLLREPGEVFELLPNEDGSWPWREDWVKKSEAGNREILDEDGDMVLVQFADKHGAPMHRDFAIDQGLQLMKRGPMRGESVHLGWMRRVPDETPCGLYQEGTDFWNGETPPGEEPIAPRRGARSATQAASVSDGHRLLPGSTARAAPIRGSTARPRREHTA
jgi:hypothetical protein